MSDGSAVVAGGVAVGGPVKELNSAARHQQDLGREAVGLLAVLAPLPGLQLARDVDEPALLRVLFQHVDQAILERNCAVPLGAVDPLAALLFYRFQMQAVPPQRVIFRML